MEAAERKIHEDVARYGWHAMNVLPEGELPGFQYSIGFFETFGQPEVLIFGQRSEVMHGMLSVVADGLRAGRRYEAGADVDDLLSGYRCLFREIPKARYGEHFGWAVRFYGDRVFRAVQCIWPDPQGIYPWQAEASEELRRREPVIAIL